MWSQVQDPRWKEVTSATEDGPDVEIAKRFSEYCERLERDFPRHQVEEPRLRKPRNLLARRPPAHEPSQEFQCATRIKNQRAFAQMCV